MKKITLVLCFFMMASSVSAAGIESVTNEEEPVVVQAEPAKQEENILIQLIAVLVAWFLLL
tara:strand:+ start:209 stop:391 length:183 start_codon:yes stop_codon:yes gene_type:complete